MFWALILEPLKRYTQRVKHKFHVTKACLDLTVAYDLHHIEPVQVIVKRNNKSFLVCNLTREKFQTSLDLIFEKGESITFYCNGRASIHMTGYRLPNENLDSDSEEETEEEEQEEEVRLNTIPEKCIKRKIESPKSKKKPKLAKQDSFENINWDHDVDEENNSFFEEDSNNDEDMEDEEDENDDDVLTMEEEEQEHEHEEFRKSQKHEKKETENQQQNQQKKKHDKQNKVNGEEIKQEQQSKKQKKKAEQQKNNLIEAKKKRIIEGGVQVEDIDVGNGALATSGKLVAVYYAGRYKILKGKEKGLEEPVDCCVNGNGFKFRLGKGQVIRGWDVGILGMKVGGKRRLWIPPNMGYGAKGSPPTVPGNTTLIYDIELRSVN